MKKAAIRLFVSVISVLGMGACSYTSDALFPSLLGTDSQEESSADISASALPALGTTNFEPLEISEGGNTGTFVGQKVVGFRNELTQLQNSIKNYNAELQKIRTSVINNALQYHKVTGAIEAKLQIGTTPGNPQMYTMLQSAQNNIQVMSANTNSLESLSAKVNSDAAMTTYLLDSIKAAFGVSGAVDEDHRQLRILENETNQTSILINSLASEINNDIVRQQQYVETARNYIIDLNGAIQTGSYNGMNFNSSAPVRPLISSSSAAPAAHGRRYSGSPLFVAKFNKSDVKFHDGLKQAVSSAVQKKPGVMFEVVAVSPARGSSLNKSNAQNYASLVFQDMVNMGVGADKISLSAKTSENATSSEVHVYVK